MRKLILTLGAMAAFVNAAAISDYVVAVDDNVGVYRNQNRKLFEKPIFTIGKTDQLQVVESGKEKFKVYDTGDRCGWVEKNHVRTGSARAFFFEIMEVTGYPDNPETKIIFDGDQVPDASLHLDRSFKENLIENIDRETADRIAN